MRKVIPESYAYVESLTPAESGLKLRARENSAVLGLEAISVSKLEAGLLGFFLEGLKPEKVVEIGTLTGLSALYLLEALPAHGKLWTLEKAPEHARLASLVLNDNRCRLLTGDAREKLDEIKNEGPFDAVFIDGNKSAYLDYFEWAVANVKAGGLIVADNVFLAGAVWGAPTLQKFNEKQIRAVSDMNTRALTSDNLRSVIIPTEEGMLVCKKLF